MATTLTRPRKDVVEKLLERERNQMMLHISSLGTTVSPRTDLAGAQLMQQQLQQQHHSAEGNCQ